MPFGYGRVYSKNVLSACSLTMDSIAMKRIQASEFRANRFPGVGRRNRGWQPGDVLRDGQRGGGAGTGRIHQRLPHHSGPHLVGAQGAVLVHAALGRERGPARVGLAGPVWGLGAALAAIVGIAGACGEQRSESMERYGQEFEGKIAESYEESEEWWPTPPKPAKGTPNVGFACKVVWPGPGASQVRDKRLCQVETPVIRERAVARPQDTPHLNSALLILMHSQASIK